jgi:hypothetical protein
MIRFTASGHRNIRATHQTTIEFTKDKTLSLRGNCVVGVNADFDAEELKRFVKKHKKIRVLLKVNNLEDEIIAEGNDCFDDEKEVVIRKSDFSSERTLAIKANKAAFELRRDIVEKLKEPEQIIKVIIN